MDNSEPAGTNLIIALLDVKLAVGKVDKRNLLGY